MTDVQLLLVTFLALCLMQSVRIVPSDLLILQKGILRSWRITRPSFRFGSGRLSIVLLDPLSLSGSAFAVRSVPFAISSAGLVGVGPEDSLASGSRSPRLVPTEQLSKVQAIDTELMIGDERLLSFLHADNAESTVDQLHKLSSTDQSTAANMILHAWFDDSACQQKIEYVRSAIRSLRVGSLLFLLLIISFLVVWDRAGFNAARWLLIPIVSVWILSIFWLWRSYRTLFPEARRSRLFAAIEAIFYPISLVRASDSLTLPATELFHPTTVAIALAQPIIASRISAIALRKLRYPVKDKASGNQLAESVMTSTRERVKIELESLLSRHSLDAEKILENHRQLDTNSDYYCPRCLSCYLSKIDECPDCPGVKLLPNDLKIH